MASLKKHKRGVVSKVFSEIERECSTIRLGDYVSIHRGGSPRPIDAYITDDTDGINWIKIGDTSADDLYICLLYTSIATLMTSTPAMQRILRSAHCSKRCIIT